jgi:hypothetical protein
MMKNVDSYECNGLTKVVDEVLAIAPTIRAMSRPSDAVGIHLLILKLARERSNGVPILGNGVPERIHSRVTAYGLRVHRLHHATTTDRHSYCNHPHHPHHSRHLSTNSPKTPQILSLAHLSLSLSLSLPLSDISAHNPGVPRSWHSIDTCCEERIGVGEVVGTIRLLVNVMLGICWGGLNKMCGNGGG